jgi:hypothetical protein
MVARDLSMQAPETVPHIELAFRTEMAFDGCVSGLEMLGAGVTKSAAEGL